MKFLRITLSICSILTLGGSVFGQLQPFWTENFSDGDIPTGWKNEETASGKNCIWTWCADPEIGDKGGCPDIWNTPVNQQKAFAASTAKTGFVTLDSDDYGNIAKDHVSQLTTSAINCSGKNQVWLLFQTHIGVYTYGADNNAIIRVSTDGSNWTNFQVFTGLTTSVRWSDNPEYPVIDISSVAANQAKVYIQWQWTGNYEYHWNLDDIELYTQDPTPPNDIAISEYFYPVSSYSTPESQIATDTFEFFARLSNLGLEMQTNLKLKVWVENETGFLLHADSMFIPQFDVDQEDVQFDFAKTFVPKLIQGRYKIHYSVSNATPDGRPNDNHFSSDFLVTPLQFAKEEKPEQGYRPSSDDLTETWYVCNMYQVSSTLLDNYKAVQAEFTFTTDPTELAIDQVEASVFLLQVRDTVKADLSNLNDDMFFDSFDWLGFSEYKAPAGLADDYLIQKTELVDLNTSELGVRIEAGKRYFLAVSYSAPFNVAYQAFNDDVDYLFPSTLIYTDAWGSWGSDVNAVIRMNLSLVLTTDEKPLPAEALKVFPNPANDFVNLQVNFKHPTDATITIAQLDGRVVSILEKTGLTQEKISITTANMASGSYIARIATREGTRTIKFVVSH